MIQATNIAEEWVNDAHKQWKDKEGWHIATIEMFAVAKKRIKDLNTKMMEADRERKSVEVALAGVQKQAKDQHLQLCRTEDQLVIAKEQIKALKKKLEKAKEAAAQAEQEGYDVGVKETEESIRTQITDVCQGYCPQVRIEALNQAGVDASSVLRRTENAFYSTPYFVDNQFS